MDRPADAPDARPARTPERIAGASASVPAERVSEREPSSGRRQVQGEDCEASLHHGPEDALAAWVVSHGGTIGSIEVARTECGRGVVATSDISPGELLLEVPHSLLLCGPPSTTSGVERTAADAVGVAGLEHDDQLCLRLLREHAAGASSRWSPWLKTLPTEHTTPLLGPEAQLEQLQCPELIRKLRAAREALDQRFERIRGAVDDSWEAYMWAVATVMSRASYMPPIAEADAAAAHDAAAGSDSCLVGAMSSACLVPLGDMFNHSASSGAVAEFEPESRSYRYIAGEAHRMGDELFLNYGAHDDATLLQLYGYVPPENPHRRRALSGSLLKDDLHGCAVDALGLSDDDSEYLHRHDLLTELFLTSEGCSWNLQAVLRLKHASESEREGGAALTILEGEPLSSATEQLVWAEVRKLAERELELLCSSLDADRAEKAALEARPPAHAESMPGVDGPGCKRMRIAPQSPSESAGHKLPLEFRITQKELLHSSINACQHRLLNAGHALE